MKKNNKKGFTLAELLIVVAIIGILVAISIPVFTAQLKKAKDATNKANARSMYAQLVADYLGDDVVDHEPSGSFPGTITVDDQQYKFTAVDDADLTWTTGDASTSPTVTYTDFKGSVNAFGGAE